MLSCSFRSCMAAGVLLTFHFFTHLIPKLSHVDDGTRFERVFPKMLDTRNRGQPPAICFDGSVQASCFSVLRFVFHLRYTNQQGQQFVHFSPISTIPISVPPWHFPQNLQVLFVPSTTTTIVINIIISPSTARSLYDVMNGGCQGGKGRGLGREKRWNQANSIVLLFFFPPSARMIDDTRGRPHGPATTGKR